MTDPRDRKKRRRRIMVAIVVVLFHVLGLLSSIHAVSVARLTAPLL